MKTFDDLPFTEKESLLKYPAYISLLAGNNNGHLNENEKKAAIKLSHIKTYSCDPALAKFYMEADKVFEKNIESIDSELPKEKSERESAIKKELVKIEDILSNLDARFADIMKHSMKSFKEHVSRANHNVLEYFIFPVTLSKVIE